MNRIYRSLTWIVWFIITSGASLYAQNDVNFIERDNEEKRRVPRSLLNIVSVDLNDVPFEEALLAIAEKGNFSLNYNRDRIPVNMKVSVKMNNVSALEALIKILRDTGTGITVTKEGNIAIIPSPNAKGRITGKVQDEETGKPLVGVNIIVIGTYKGAATDSEGRFTVTGLSLGSYTVEVSMMGYEIQQSADIIVNGGSASEVNFKLSQKVYSLDEVIVTPGHFTLMERVPVSKNALKAEDIRSFPQLGEDIYRAVKRLPGVSGNDMAAGFTIRGGEHDEVLVQLDGVELYEPFHLKDVEGLMSIIDVESIHGIDMMTGAFPAEYGDRLSGVFNMKTITPVVDRNRRSLAVSFLNVRAMTEKTFDNGKGQSLLLFRRGYIDLLMKEVRRVEENSPPDEFSPVYYDFLAKIQYNVHPNHLLSMHLLWANDDLSVSDEDDAITAKSTYVNGYAWLRWHAKFSSSLLAETVISAGKIDKDKSVEEWYDYGQEGRSWQVRDNVNHNVFNVKQNWNLNLSDRWIVKGGFNAKWLSADYDFFSKKYVRILWEDDGIIYRDWVWDSTTVIGKQTGEQLGLYLSNRVRILSPLVAEAGVRYDRANWTDDENISPRLNAVLELGERTSLRLGWGRFYQTQGIYDLEYQDGEDRFHKAEMENHRVIGVEHETAGGINIRVEGYLKERPKIRPYYINFAGPWLNLIPGAEWDRIKLEPEEGESKGIEIYFNNNSGGKFRWWASYSYAKVSEVIDGATYPKYYDQRHTLYLDVSYTPNSKWRYNVAWQYHSGWPYTRREVANLTSVNGGWDWDWVPGPFLAERFPAYHRMDVRINRSFETSRGLVSAFLEVRNLYNRKNMREYWYRVVGELPDNYRVVEEEGPEIWMPLLPSFGIRWDF